MKVKVIGIDLAKNVFQLHGVDQHGHIVLQKRLSRRKLAELMAKLPPCLVGMEACRGAHYWARKAVFFGHEVVEYAALIGLKEPKIIKYVIHQGMVNLPPENRQEQNCIKNETLVFYILDGKYKRSKLPYHPLPQGI